MAMPSVGPLRDDVRVSIDPVLDAVRTRVQAQPPRCGAVRVVCVDGPAGSGKTTLAGQLAAALGNAPIVHLDDLYHGWAQPLGAPLSARLEAWLLDAWAAGLPGRYLRYDWHAGRYVEWVAVEPAPIVVLEGCGSGAAAIRARAALVVWVDASVDTRLARGLARDGEAMRQQWLDWQRAEQAHFDSDGTGAAADVRVWTADDSPTTFPGEVVTRRSIAMDPPPR